jgi:SPP1 gp7 family putative phage head morphogenesis protein
MAKKTTFNNPDSQEREYTRFLLKYSKQLQADVNRVLLPRIDHIIVQFKVETRTDSWIDTLDSLIAELGKLALGAAGAVFAKLPGLYTAISKFNEGQFKLVVKANTGLPLPPVMPGAPSSAILGVNVFRSEPFLKPLAEGWISENTSLIKSLPTRLHPELEGIIRRGVMNGQSVKDIKDQIKSRYGVSDYRAKLIAQDQTLKLNADLTRYRLQSVGVEEYVWRSVQDSRVRPDHAERNGNTYSWKEGPSNGSHPGQEVRCRCRAEAIWDEG